MFRNDTAIFWLSSNPFLAYILPDLVLHSMDPTLTLVDWAAACYATTSRRCPHPSLRRTNIEVNTNKQLYFFRSGYRDIGFDLKNLSLELRGITSLSTASSPVAPPPGFFVPTVSTPINFPPPHHSLYKLGFNVPRTPDQTVQSPSPSSNSNLFNGKYWLFLISVPRILKIISYIGDNINL